MRKMLSVILLIVICLSAAHCATAENIRVTVVPPSCTEAGYTLYESIESGITTVHDEVPATGHQFGEWQEDPRSGGSQRVCKVCGYAEARSSKPISSFPIVYLNGNTAGISKSERVTLEFAFESEETSFSCYAYTTWQGHQTLNYPKKNYTIRLYDDEEISHKHKLSFNRWQYEHKYVLKANYRDISAVRNLIAADIWADMASARPHLYPMLLKTSHYGAVDGFPVAVYLNDEFHGLYNMNLHIDDDLYRMTDQYDAVMIANSSEPEETRFFSPALFIDEKDAWEVEYCGTGNDNQWAKDKLNELIGFVINSSDEEFRRDLGAYLDVNGAIDYLIFIYITGLDNNAAKDLVLLKYQGSDVWIPTVYDMERAFGLARDGEAYVAANEFLPTENNGVWDSNTNSLLWDRLLQNYTDEIRMRYRRLRTGILTTDALTERVREAISEIPPQYYNMDMETYPRCLLAELPEEQMTDYIQSRLPLLDMALLGNLVIEDGDSMEDSY